MRIRDRWGGKATQPSPPARYRFAPSAKAFPVPGKCALRPRENEKPKGFPVAPIFAASVSSSFFRPPGCESTNLGASGSSTRVGEFG